MSDLTPIEKRKLEKLFEMDSGHVLDFSHRTLENIIIDTVEIDPYNNEKYQGLSKANVLRTFWEDESNFIVGKLLKGLLVYWKEIYSEQRRKQANHPDSLYSDCEKISQRLIQSNSIQEINFDVHFENIKSNIMEQIKLAKYTI
ncbi:MAG: hypothetical protein H7A23_01015 [Leptospiraceae bacterium]|nr:hypothetical protein [Leptospiraceae bacterium]MCP5493111.1 hypothetical protein [Leptospiraceae bacterium]